MASLIIRTIEVWKKLGILKQNKNQNLYIGIYVL